MSCINYKQYRLLRRCRKFGTVLQTASLTAEEREACAYLLDCKLLEIVTAEHDERFRRVAKTYKITQRGCAELSAYVRAFHKWWIPLIIAIVAALGAYIPLIMAVV